MPAHPKPLPRAKKLGAMRTKPKAEKKPVAPAKVVKASTLAPKPKPAPSAKPAAPEGQSKSALIVQMLSTAGGATSKELEAATGWAPHSVRGLLGTMRAKGVNVVSTKIKGEPTIYRIEAVAMAETADVI